MIICFYTGFFEGTKSLFIYSSGHERGEISKFRPAGKIVQSSTPGAARFAQLYQPSPPHSSRSALFEMDPRPSTPSPLLSFSPSACIIRQLFYDSPLSISAPAIHAPVVAKLAHDPSSLHPTRDVSFLVCAEEFFADNPLIAATLQPRTRDVYAVALEIFRGSAFASGFYALSLDHRICLHIHD